MSLGVSSSFCFGSGDEAPEVVLGSFDVVVYATTTTRTLLGEGFDARSVPSQEDGMRTNETND